PTLNTAARLIQTMLQARASRRVTSWASRWKTPRSTASMPSTKTRNTAQGNSSSNTEVSGDGGGCGKEGKRCEGARAYEGHGVPHAVVARREPRFTAWRCWRQRNTPPPVPVGHETRAHPNSDVPG